MSYLGSVVHSTPVHPFKPLAHAALLNLSLLLLLAVLEVSPVTKLHQVSGLVDLALETTKSRLYWLSLSDLNLYRNCELGGGCENWRAGC